MLAINRKSMLLQKRVSTGLNMPEFLDQINDVSIVDMSDFNYGDLDVELQEAIHGIKVANVDKRLDTWEELFTSMLDDKYPDRIKDLQIFKDKVKKKALAPKNCRRISDVVDGLEESLFWNRYGKDATSYYLLANERIIGDKNGDYPIRINRGFYQIYGDAWWYDIDIIVNVQKDKKLQRVLEIFQIYMETDPDKNELYTYLKYFVESLFINDVRPTNDIEPDEPAKQIAKTRWYFKRSIKDNGLLFSKLFGTQQARGTVPVALLAKIIGDVMGIPIRFIKYQTENFAMAANMVPVISKDGRYIKNKFRMLNPLSTSHVWSDAIDPNTVFPFEIQQ